MSIQFRSDGHYILGGDDGHTPIEEQDMMKWSVWFEHENRVVKQEPVGKYEVSTVFLGLDHSFARHREHTPILFETMVFLEQPDPKKPRESLDIMERCATWDEALEQHARVVAEVGARVEKL